MGQGEEIGEMNEHKGYDHYWLEQVKKMGGEATLVVYHPSWKHREFITWKNGSFWWTDSDVERAYKETKTSALRLLVTASHSRLIYTMETPFAKMEYGEEAFDDC